MTRICSRFTDAFLVMKDGIILTEEYFNGMSQSSFHLLNSVSKSFIRSLNRHILSHEDILRPEDRVTRTYSLLYITLPELQDTAFRETSIQRGTLDMTGGVKYDEDYVNPYAADFWIGKQQSSDGGPSLSENPIPKKTLFEFALSLAESEQDNGAKFDYRTRVHECFGNGSSV